MSSTAWSCPGPEGIRGSWRQQDWEVDTWSRDCSVRRGLSLLLGWLQLSLGRVSGDGDGRGRDLCCICGKNGQNAQSRTNESNYNSDLYAASMSFSKVQTIKVLSNCLNVSMCHTYSLTLKISLLQGLSQGHLEWCAGYFYVNLTQIRVIWETGTPIEKISL